MTGIRKKDHHLPKRVYQKNGAFWYVTLDKKWIRLGTHWDAMARAKWIEIDAAPVAAGTMADMINQYLAKMGPTLAPATLKSNEGEAVHLIRVFGKMQPDAVLSKHCARYLALRGEKAPVRANREMALLSSVFSWGMGRQMASSNPTIGVRRNPERSRTRCPTPAEFLAVQKVAERWPPVPDVMDLAYLTLQRGGDLIPLRLSQLGEDGISLVQNKSKRGAKREGGKKILIEWSPALREVVARLQAKKMPKSKKNTVSMFLIRNRSGNPYTRSGFKAVWTKVMNEAMRLGVIEERFHFHDIRAMGATELDDAGRNPQQLLGHASRTTTEIYLRSRKTVKEAPAK